MTISALGTKRFESAIRTANPTGETGKRSETKGKADLQEMLSEKPESLKRKTKWRKLKVVVGPAFEVFHQLGYEKTV